MALKGLIILVLIIIIALTNSSQWFPNETNLFFGAILNRNILSNSVWMMAEKVVAIFGLIFITSFVAKYVGPSVYGEIALASSLFQIIQVIGQLGSDVIIFKRISQNKRSGVFLMKATTLPRATIYILFSIPILVYNFFWGMEGGFYFVFACFLSCLISSMDVYTIYYDAILKSKINTMFNVIGLSASLLLRWCVGFYELEPVYLCFPIIFSPLIPLVLRYFVFMRNDDIPLLSRNIKSKYKKYLLSTGFSIVLSSLSVAIYTRLSLLTVGYFLDKEAVGVYSIAVSLATSWSFILNAFVTSVLPSIFSEKNESQTLKKSARLNIFLICISMPILLIIVFVGNPFIRYLYGNAYLDSYYPLIILSVGTLISSLGVVCGRLIAKYSGYKYLSKKMILLTVVSFFVNIIFVYFYGVNGAAIANLITQLLSLTIFNYFYKNGLIIKLHCMTFKFWKLGNIKEG